MVGIVTVHEVAEHVAHSLRCLGVSNATRRRLHELLDYIFLFMISDLLIRMYPHTALMALKYLAYIFPLSGTTTTADPSLYMCLASKVPW